MRSIVKKVCVGVCVAGLLSATSATAAKKYRMKDVGEYMKAIEADAKAEGATSFSAAQGKALYESKHSHPKSPNTRSCTTCHTNSPTRTGETLVGKKIKPLALSANSKRLTKVKKIEKWFRRNCKWTLQRACTATEKVNFIRYIQSK